MNEVIELSKKKIANMTRENKNLSDKLNEFHQLKLEVNRFKLK